MWGKLRKQVDSILHRFYNLERKLALSKNAEMSIKYHEKVTDLINKGICESIGSLDGHLDSIRNDPDTYLLPTNMVISKRTSTSSYRLCLDGSTLSSLLNSGPNLLADLTELLLRFRSKPYTVQLDLKEAYFQVLVHPNDRKLLRFLHRPQGASKPEVLESTRLVMGVIDSQFQMVSCLHVIAEKYAPSIPRWQIS